MASGHSATPNSEVSNTISPREPDTTAPSSIAKESAASNNNDSEMTKVVSAGGV